MNAIYFISECQNSTLFGNANFKIKQELAGKDISNITIMGGVFVQGSTYFVQAELIDIADDCVVAKLIKSEILS